MKEDQRKSRVKRAGSRVLVEILILVLIVFVMSNIVVFFLFGNSQNRLVQKSKDKLVEYKAEQICSTNEYVTNLMIQITLASQPNTTPQAIQDELISGVKQQVITPSQQIIDDMLKMLVENGFFGSTLAFYALPTESGLVSKPTIVMSSDDDNIYSEVPSELANLAEMDKGENTKDRTRIDQNNSYMFSLDGLQELGFDDEYLVIAHKFKPEGFSSEMWYFDLVSMHDEVAGIDSFYKTERKDINLFMILVMAGSIIALILITFIVLNYLIRKRITKPIDELSDVAEKVMEGDIDTVVPLREGEEFYGLKMAFNDMLSSLRKIISKSVEDSLDSSEASENETHQEKGSWIRGRIRGRNSILFQISILLVVVFMISGLLSFLFFNRSEARLVEKSKEKIVQSAAETVCSGHYYVSSLISRYYSIVIASLLARNTTKEMFVAIRDKKTSQIQAIMNDILSDLIKKKFQGLILAIEALAPIPGFFDETTIIMSTDEKYMYMKLPDELNDLFEMSPDQDSAYRKRIDKDNAYMLVKDGLPSMGLSGEYLVTAYKHEADPSTPEFFRFFNFKPMSGKLAAIDSFYANETRTAAIVMSIVMAVGTTAVLVITLVVLSFLIRIRITEPIDELAAIAEQVVDGNLDIEAQVRKGEEFEGLKNAFNEMLISLRELISKSTLS